MNNTEKFIEETLGLQNGTINEFIKQNSCSIDIDTINRITEILTFIENQGPNTKEVVDSISKIKEACNKIQNLPTAIDANPILTLFTDGKIPQQANPKQYTGLLPIFLEKNPQDARKVIESFSREEQDNLFKEFLSRECDNYGTFKTLFDIAIDLGKQGLLLDWMSVGYYDVLGTLAKGKDKERMLKVLEIAKKDPETLRKILDDKADWETGGFVSLSRFPDNELFIQSLNARAEVSGTKFGFGTYDNLYRVALGYRAELNDVEGMRAIGRILSHFHDTTEPGEAIFGVNPIDDQNYRFWDDDTVTTFGDYINFHRKNLNCESIGLPEIGLLSSHIAKNPDFLYTPLAKALTHASKDVLEYFAELSENNPELSNALKENLKKWIVYANLFFGIHEIDRIELDYDKTFQEQITEIIPILENRSKIFGGKLDSIIYGKIFLIAIKKQSKKLLIELGYYMFHYAEDRDIQQFIANLSVIRNEDYAKNFRLVRIGDIGQILETISNQLDNFDPTKISDRTIGEAMQTILPTTDITVINEGKTKVSGGEMYETLVALFTDADKAEKNLNMGPEWARKALSIFSSLEEVGQYLGVFSTWAGENMRDLRLYASFPGYGYGIYNSGFNFPGDIEVPSLYANDRFFTMAFDFPEIKGELRYKKEWANLVIKNPELSRHIGMFPEIDAYLSEYRDEFPSSIEEIENILLIRSCEALELSDELKRNLKTKIKAKREKGNTGTDVAQYIHEREYGFVTMFPIEKDNIQAIRSLIWLGVIPKTHLIQGMDERDFNSIQVSLDRNLSISDAKIIADFIDSIPKIYDVMTENNRVFINLDDIEGAIVEEIGKQILILLLLSNISYVDLFDARLVDTPNLDILINTILSSKTIHDVSTTPDNERTERIINGIGRNNTVFDIVEGRMIFSYGDKFISKLKVSFSDRIDFTENEILDFQLVVKFLFEDAYRLVLNNGGKATDLRP